MNISKCRSCGSEIIWAKHSKTNKLAPYDKEPTNNGQWLLERETQLALTDEKENESEVFISRHKNKHDEILGIPGHINHFATCPQANQWRSKC